MRKLFVVSSPSASGKTTLVDTVIKKYNLHKLKTCTTRSIRKEETGNEYYFFNRPCFQHKINNNEFLEFSEVYDNYYGILKEEFEKNKDKDCIIILDVQGKQKAEKEFDIVSIFINPPDKETVIERLKSRNTNEYDVQARINEFDYEISLKDTFDYSINYGDLDNMINQMENIIRRELMST